MTPPAMTTPQGMLAEAKAIAALANRIEELKPFNAKSPDGAEWERYVINVSPKERDRVAAALRQAAQGREATIEQCAKVADKVADEWSAKAGVALENDRVLYGHPQITARRIAETIRALTPAVAGVISDEMVEAAAQEFERHAWPDCPWNSIHESGRERYRKAARDGLTAALALIPAADGAGEPHPFQQCEKCWQPATCKKYGCRDKGLAALAQAQEPGPTAEDIYACAETTLIGFRDELTEDQIKFICDQISRKATLSHNGTRKET